MNTDSLKSVIAIATCLVVGVVLFAVSVYGGALLIDVTMTPLRAAAQEMAATLGKDTESNRVLWTRDYTTETRIALFVTLVAFVSGFVFSRGFTGLCNAARRKISTRQ